MSGKAKKGKKKKKGKNKRKPPANEYGKVTGPGTVRLERLLPGPIERAWAYLTDPEKRGKWLASGAVDLRVGGRVELKFHHSDLSAEKTPPAEYKQFEDCTLISGHIIRCEPPRLLSYTWGDAPGKQSEVTFELTPRGKDVLLVVTHRRLGDRPTMVSVAAGWHTHLAILIDHFNGLAPRPFWTTLVHTKAEYEKRIAK
jgi:uncharacterized protein YndB with AHSA1/START domain